MSDRLELVPRPSHDDPAKNVLIGQVVTELGELGKGAGVSVARLEAETPVLCLLAEALRDANPGEYPDAAAAARRLVDDAFSDLDRDTKDTVDAFLGITVSGPSQASRQDAVDRRREVPRGRSTYARHRGDALAVFARRYVARANGYQARRTSPMAGAADAPYQLTSLTALYRIAANRAVDHVVCLEGVTATREGPLDFDIHHSYFEETNADALQVEPLFGCRLVGERHTVGDTTFATLRLTDDARIGQTYRIAYVVRCQTDRAITPLIFATPDSDLSELVIGVDFDGEPGPELEKFKAVTYLQAIADRAPGAPLASREQLVRWTGVRQGLCYGLRWRWE